MWKVRFWGCLPGKIQTARPMTSCYLIIPQRSLSQVPEVPPNLFRTSRFHVNTNTVKPHYRFSYLLALYILIPRWDQHQGFSKSWLQTGFFRFFGAGPLPYWAWFYKVRWWLTRSSHGNLKNIVMDLKALLSPIKPMLAQKKECKKSDSTFPESWSRASAHAPALHTLSDTPQLMT